ncbi:MAG: hypothetical protein FWH02_00690 [Oscillospiraceae bacterium]|nr:hypothetical protein [Oscillospiraceae bacterium]
MRLNISDSETRRIEALKREYLGGLKSPKIIMNYPGTPLPTKELITSPKIMLDRQLKGIQAHLEIGDDVIPQVGIAFGTGQIAHAFGCEMRVPTDSPVCATGNLQRGPREIAAMDMPDLDAGWFAKAYEYTEYFLENKPSWVEMEVLDLQSALNNAYLVRGDDLLYDFYDDPEGVELLLEKMTDYQIAQTKRYREFIGAETGVLYDWSVAWKGGGRVADCAVHMISTDFYDDFIKKHDARIIRELDGGRIHYCGAYHDGLVASLGDIPGMTGFDLDGKYHDPWQISREIPDDIPLLVYITQEQTDRLLSGDIPEKRNLILQVWTSCQEEAKELYPKLKSLLH